MVSSKTGGSELQWGSSHADIPARAAYQRFERVAADGDCRHHSSHYCLLVGLYIAFARPTDPLAWITMAMLASFNQTAVSLTSILLPSPWREFLLAYKSVLGNTWPLWMLLLGFYFLCSCSY